MKFLCVGYFDAAKMEALSEEQLEAVMGECPPHMDALYQSGKVSMLAGVELESTGLRRVHGKLEVAADPTKDSREKIGCVYLIEAQDMAEAIRVASLHPTTQVEAGEKLGWRTEIRPIHTFEQRAGKT